MPSSPPELRALAGHCWRGGQPSWDIHGCLFCACAEANEWDSSSPHMVWTAGDLQRVRITREGKWAGRDEIARYCASMEKQSRTSVGSTEEQVHIPSTSTKALQKWAKLWPFLWFQNPQIFQIFSFIFFPPRGKFLHTSVYLWIQS